MAGSARLDFRNRNASEGEAHWPCRYTSASTQISLQPDRECRNAHQPRAPALAAASKALQFHISRAESGASFSAARCAQACT